MQLIILSEWYLHLILHGTGSGCAHATSIHVITCHWHIGGCFVSKSTYLYKPEFIAIHFSVVVVVSLGNAITFPFSARVTRDQISFFPEEKESMCAVQRDKLFFRASLILCDSSVSQATRQNPILDAKLTDSNRIGRERKGKEEKAAQFHY